MKTRGGWIARRCGVAFARSLWVFAVLTAVVTLIVTTMLPDVSFAQTQLIAAHSSNRGQSTYIFFDELAKRVDSLTNGQLKLRVHPSGELGADEQVMQSLKLGTIHLGSASAGNMGALTTAYFWADLPYVFAGREGAAKIFADESILAIVSEQVKRDLGTVVLAHVEVGGFRVFSNIRRPLKTPADAKGLKFRVTASQVDLELNRAWGVIPTPIVWSETFPAIQQGAIDGVHLQPQALKYFGFGQIVKHGTFTKTVMTFHVAQINAKTWERLSPEFQKAIRTATKEALVIANKADQDDEAGCVKDLTTMGMVFYTPMPDEAAQWRRPAQSVWDKFKDKIDQKLLSRITEIQK